MNIWLLRASELMPVVNKGDRLLRMGMLAEELSKRNHTITWFSSTFDHFKKKQLFNKDTTVKVKDNYHINLIYAPGYKKNISVARIINHKIIASKFRKIAEKLEKPDLIYAAFPTIDYAEQAVKYGKKHGVPVIVDIRDLWPDTFRHNLSEPLRTLARPYIKLMDYKTKKLMKDAFAINSISEAMLDWGLEKAKREKGKYDKYFFIGYDKKEIPQNTKDIDIIERDKFNIAFLATINNQFDYNKIAQIATILEKKDKDIVINICGVGPQYKDLQERVKGISNIRLLGWVGKDELNYILNNSKIGFAPYKNTFDFQMSVSNKFGEYLSYGLPIVMTVDGYMQKLLIENNCGISTQDVDKICDFLLDIKSDEEKYNTMSSNAKKIYEESFVAKEIYKNLANYLEKIKEEQKNEVCTNRMWENSTKPSRSSCGE